MSTLKTVAQNSFLYTASSILLRASSLLFFPIFSLYLTKSDYGILSITQSIGSFVALSVGLELNKALTRFIFNQNNPENKAHNTLIYSTLLTSLSFGLIIVFLLSLFGSFLLKPILNDIPYYPYVFVFLLSIPINTIVDTCRVYYKATHQGVNVFRLDMSFFSFNILLNLFFVVVLKMNVLGILMGNLINTIIFSIVLYFIFYRKLTFNYDKKITQSALKYALPLIPYAVLNILFESVDKFFLNANSGAQESGIYYIALTFAGIFSSAKESVVNAFTPWLFGNIKSQTEQKIAEIINTIFVGAGMIALGIAWFSKEILMLLSSNPDFIEAYHYIPFTVMGLFVIFLGQLFNMKTFYYGKFNHLLFLATLTGIIADIIACYFLVALYGIHGAVFARLIAFSVQVVIIIYLSHLEKEKREIYQLKKLSFILFCFCLMMIAPLALKNMPYLLIGKILIYSAILTTTLSFLNRKINLLQLLKNKLNK